MEAIEVSFMDSVNNHITPHPCFLEVLFGCRHTTSSLFKKFLAHYDIQHIAFSYVNDQQELLTLSSTPALEFNLFHSALWHYDQTYQPVWYESEKISKWQSLYSPARYEALYYLKQGNFHYPNGISFARHIHQGRLICSIASHKSKTDLYTVLSPKTRHCLENLGIYCANQLLLGFF